MAAHIKSNSAMVIPEKIKGAVDYLATVKPGEEVCFYHNLSSLVDDVLTERTKDNKTNIVEFYDVPPIKGNQPPKQQDITNNQVKNEIRLFEAADEENIDIPDKEENFELPLVDCCRTGYFFEQAGIGFGQEETFRIFLALKSLAMECTFVSVRFWGKIFGVKANYYIVEAEYREGEGDKPSIDIDDDETNDNEATGGDSDIEEPKEDERLPKPDWKEPDPIRSEDHHNGANRYVYFVCNKLGDGWTRLPHTNPTDIVSSRHISKLMSGDLNTAINSYPPFSGGTESNLLRALIARISACTQISPTGYYMFDEEGTEEDEEEEIRDSYMVNMTFEGIPVRQLKEEYGFNWVHHSKYILPQGRCTWWSPAHKYRDDFDEDEELEESETHLPQETGPQLLLSVGNDKKVRGDHPAWSASYSSKILPAAENCVCVMKSNQWPGAYAFSNGKLFENVYIGWAQKYLSNGGYSPAFPPQSFDEYLKGDDVIELDDPTVEQEEEAKTLEEEANKSADEIENVEDEDED